MPAGCPWGSQETYALALCDVGKFGYRYAYKTVHRIDADFFQRLCKYPHARYLIGG